MKLHQPLLVAAVFASLLASRASYADSLLSQGRTAWQSSTISGGVASRANDGNTDSNWFHNSVSSTDYNYQPWWQVDLGASYNVSSVQIYNRTDWCSDCLGALEVLISDQPISSDDLTNPYLHPNIRRYYPPSTTSSFISVPTMSGGRYVMVAMIGRSWWLDLAEVKVFGTGMAMQMGDFADLAMYQQGGFNLQTLWTATGGAKRTCPGGGEPQCVRCWSGTCVWSCRGGAFCFESTEGTCSSTPYACP
jgi:hypothetical protein